MAIKKEMRLKYGFAQKTKTKKKEQNTTSEK
jgi:hypothetical protein